MELTPKKIVDQIKQLLPTFAEFEDSEGNIIQGDPIAWLKYKIEEYGEQQHKKAIKDVLKMELTNELKARFFALYWGQNVVKDKEGSIIVNVDMLQMSFMRDVIGIENYELVLRPLSSITEEEALECAQAGFNQEEIENSTKVFSALFVSLSEFVYERFSSITETEGGYVMHTLASIDYLRSKGFALPFMGISVGEMVKAGWIKLKD